MRRKIPLVAAGKESAIAERVRRAQPLTHAKLINTLPAYSTRCRNTL